MPDDLVKRLRWLGDHASFEPHMHHTAADRIEKLEAQLAQSQLKRWAARWEEQADRIEKLEAVIKDDALWLAAYHLWCAMKGCAPSSSDLIAARKILEGKDD